MLEGATAVFKSMYGMTFITSKGSQQAPSIISLGHPKMVLFAVMRI